MIIVAFSDKTSKILPRILCRKIKHVAPIIANKNNLIMYQFISRKKCHKIIIKMRDIKILAAHGWRFIYLPIDAAKDFSKMHALTCVQFTKNAIGLKKAFIQTPNGLYEYMRWNN